MWRRRPEPRVGPREGKRLIDPYRSLTFPHPPLTHSFEAESPRPVTPSLSRSGTGDGGGGVGLVTSAGHLSARGFLRVALNFH